MDEGMVVVVGGGVHVHPVNAVARNWLHDCHQQAFQITFGQDPSLKFKKSSEEYQSGQSWDICFSLVCLNAVCTVLRKQPG